MRYTDFMSSTDSDFKPYRDPEALTAWGDLNQDLDDLLKNPRAAASEFGLSQRTKKIIDQAYALLQEDLIHDLEGVQTGVAHEQLHALASLLPEDFEDLYTYDFIRRVMEEAPTVAERLSDYDNSALPSTVAQDIIGQAVLERAELIVTVISNILAEHDTHPLIQALPVNKLDDELATASAEIEELRQRFFGDYDTLELIEIGEIGADIEEWFDSSF